MIIESRYSVDYNGLPRESTFSNRKAYELFDDLEHEYSKLKEKYEKELLHIAYDYSELKPYATEAELIVPNLFELDAKSIRGLLLPDLIKLSKLAEKYNLEAPSAKFNRLVKEALYKDGFYKEGNMRYYGKYVITTERHRFQSHIADDEFKLTITLSRKHKIQNFLKEV